MSEDVQTDAEADAKAEATSGPDPAFAEGAENPPPAIHPNATPSARDIDSNPLRDPRDRRLPRVPAPCALVVFGITGDLARKKLLPAVYDLHSRGLLPT